MSERALNRAYLALGSNIQPEKNLVSAVRLLAKHGRILRVSSVWESAPVGFAEQPNFLNAAMLLETPHSVESLWRDVIPEIENSLGRVRDPQNKNAPRTIDVDVALFNSDVLQTEGRRIPDPQILERPFLAVSLAELDPDYVHPETQTFLAVIAEGLRVDDSSILRREDVVLPIG